MLAVAPATIKEAAQAVDNYLAIEDADQSPRAMPVESTEAPAQTTAWKADLLATAEAMTKQTALLQQLLIKVESAPAKQQDCFKCKGRNYKKTVKRWRTAGHLNKSRTDGKWGMPGTSVSCPVALSEIPDNTAAFDV